MQVYISEPNVINTELAQQVTKQRADITYVLGSEDFSQGNAAACEVLVIRSTVSVGRDIKEHFPNLSAVVRVGVGLDNVDLSYCKEAGIAVYNAPGANADAVAEYTIAAILAILRRLPLLTDADVVSWNRFKFSGESLSEQTIGIVGFGNIGRLLYQKLRGFEIKNFYVYDPFLTASDMPAENVHLVEMDELLRKSSVVSLHLPLTDETRYIINRDKLSLLPAGAIVVNASRGGIVEEAAVLELAKQRRLYYVADVVEDEPHPNPALLGQDNILITPHIASLTSHAGSEMVVRAFNNFLQGRAVRN